MIPDLPPPLIWPHAWRPDPPVILVSPECRHATYPGTLASLTPPDRPNDAYAKANAYPTGNIAKQKRK